MLPRLPRARTDGGGGRAGEVDAQDAGNRLVGLGQHPGLLRAVHAFAGLCGNPAGQARPVGGDAAEGLKKAQKDWDSFDKGFLRIQHFHDLLILVLIIRSALVR